MINNSQFRELIIRPSLQAIGLYSENVEELLVATMAHESKGGTYLAQLGGDANSALGIFQMEPATLDWLWLKVVNSPTLHSSIMGFITDKSSELKEELVFNLYFSTQMARMRYYVTPATIPDKNDLDGIWNIYKTYYNTSKGEASKNEFVADYYHFIGKGIPNGKAS